LSTGRQTEQGRAERKDLEVGAVDELLVGECVVRARDKEEENFTLLSPLASLLSTLLLTNNITPFYFLFFYSFNHFTTFSHKDYSGILFWTRAYQPTL
jgi:hypothetical protein